jgi:hypothetical protein
MQAANCYLCGKMVEAHESSGDHVVPKTFIEREQPRVKGFDYAGKLPSHRSCNNAFGPETYAVKALDLIAALYDEDCTFEYRHPANPDLQMMVLRSTCLPSFTSRDLSYFKIINATSKSKDEIHDLELLEGRRPVNPKRQSLFTALAVLTKSAAALLVSRKLFTTPSAWDVLAIPHVGDAHELDFDDIFGETTPFDSEVKVWLAQLETNDYLVIYRIKRVVVYFLFRLSDVPAAYNRMLEQFTGGSRLRFQGKNLMELVSYTWREAEIE